MIIAVTTYIVPRVDYVLLIVLFIFLLYQHYFFQNKIKFDLYMWVCLVVGEFMMSECSDIFRRYTGHLTGAIEEPSLIAADLLQNGVIAEASKSKAELNTIVSHQRSSELLTAVSRSIKVDFYPPKMFLGTIAALKKHSDTREIAIRMELEYCTFTINASVQLTYSQGTQSCTMSEP